MDGLIERDRKWMRDAFERLPEIGRVILFGSRALGKFKKGSDVDLAIVGDAVTRKTLLSLSEWLNETYPLPYEFDLLNYGEIAHQPLKCHIDQFGIEIYRRK